MLSVNDFHIRRHAPGMTVGKVGEQQYTKTALSASHKTARSMRRKTDSPLAWLISSFAAQKSSQIGIDYCPPPQQNNTTSLQ
jgi:hypothetical protein